MRTNKFVYFLLLAAASQAHAGAGQTSSGVTTTVPNDPTAASSDVQSQSSAFVQQNQALAGANGASGTAGALGNGGKSGQAGAIATDANGKPIDPNNPNNPAGDPKAANQKPAAPAAPPVPPPDYVSNIKKVDRSVAVAAVPQPAVAAADKTPAAGAKPAAPAAVDLNTVTAPGVQRQAVAQKPALRTDAEPAERTGAEHVAAGTGSSGGSGSAPDSYAFYIGLIVAGALLAFAAAMFLRVEKGGAR